jgi:Peptidase M50B-like
MAIDWNLSSCCGQEELTFCGLFIGYFVLNLILWSTPLLKPMKLIAVFIHEMGHATACWWTGGKVEAIEVYNNEGGVTKYRGGIRAIIIPAGYVGGAFWGGVFVTMSGDRVASTVAASVFVFSMLISLCYSPNRMLVILTLGFSALTILGICLEWFVFQPILPFITLYYGVFIGSFSVCK